MSARCFKKKTKKAGGISAGLRVVDGEFRLNGRRAEIRKLPELHSFNEYEEKPLSIALTAEIINNLSRKFTKYFA